MENYIFPSQKNKEKYPLIKVNGDANEFILWIMAHPELDKRVPPIYQDFRLEFATPKGILCELFVHYNDELTAFAVKARLDGENLGVLESDYEHYSDKFEVKAKLTERAGDKYDLNWLKEFTTAIVSIIIAVQAYMLYFKPEVVEKIYAPTETKKAGYKRRRVGAAPIKIRKTKIKRIILNAEDRPPRDVDYKKLSWHVRGHYRHVGKEKKLKYIQPFVCNRGGKKYHKTAPSYLLEGEGENGNGKI